MAWLRIDDKFTSHAKVAPLSDSALALWLRAAAWSQDHKTDGFIPVEQLTVLAKKPLRSAKKLAEELVNATGGLKEFGLWEEVDGGWLVHDWQDYQPPPEKLSASEAARVAGKRSAEARRQKNGTAQPNFRSSLPNVSDPFAGRSANELPSKPDPLETDVRSPVRRTSRTPVSRIPLERSKAGDVVAEDLTGSARAAEDEPPPASTIVSPRPRSQSSIRIANAQPRPPQAPQSGVSDQTAIAPQDRQATRPENPIPTGPHDPNRDRAPGTPPRPRMDVLTMVAPLKWYPSEHGLAYAQELGLDQAAIDETVSELRNYRGGTHRSVDWWDAKWNTFVETRSRRVKRSQDGSALAVITAEDEELVRQMFGSEPVPATVVAIGRRK